MSDDLISRKALLKELREILNEPHNTMFLMGIGAAITIIEHSETAFDKEKVVTELRKRRDCYDMNEEPMNVIASKEYIQEYADIREHKGKWIAYNEAIGIVEKGGIE